MMCRRRFISRLLILVCLLPWLSLSSSAHTGGTDSSGGHTDRIIGEYHYHHGYEAHQHYDMDGDGDVDCIFNFHNNESPSVNSSDKSIYSDSYCIEAYEDGYSKGHARGKSEGYLDGRIEGYSAGKEAVMEETIKELESKYAGELYAIVFASVLCTLLVVSVILLPVSLLRKRKIRFMQADHSRSIADLKKQHESSMEDLKKKYLQEKHNSTLLKIAAGDDSTIQLPPDIRLRRSFSVIKGQARDHYPYGDYTVFLSRSGRKYHCSDCCAPISRTMHFFDLSADIDPCRICVPEDMYPQPRPEWYQDIVNKLK